MSNNSKLTSSFLLIILTILSFLQSCQTKKINIDDYSSDVLSAWNDKIITIAIAEDNLLTLKGVRTAAMMHIAVHDALNTIMPNYSFYIFNGKAVDADPIATTAYAAYSVAVNQYPDKKSELESELKKWLSNLDNKESLAQSKKLAESSATAILTQRSNDKWNTEADYTWHPMGPGVYAEFNAHSGTPEGFIFGAGWGDAKPFMLTSSSQFRSPPPPDIRSDAYTNAFNEVKEYGQFESKSRSADQSHLAMWWKEFSEISHNQLTRELIKKEKLNLWVAARAFALLNMSIYDGYVSVFDNKFFYNHWRPYTAIRWAEHDGNPNTIADTAWNNLHKHTYPFPSYPSAHGTASTAGMTTLANTLGLGDEYAFTMTIEQVDKAGPFSGKIQMNPPTRSFKSFSDAGMETSLSRIYLGIHFRYDSIEGYKLGEKVGQYANENFLRPIN